jgi:pyruvate/2-oxoglutarate dehydrogenase complex dihydrolipoamide dehydrogenase (E3) component
MTPEKFDVVILGGGNAGIGATGPARRAGLSVAMIESRDLGGTCPNRGCTPKRSWSRPGMPCTKSSAPRSITFQPASPGSIGPP